MFRKIKSIVEQTDTKAGRVFDFFIQGLIIISLISFSVETLPDNSAQLQKILKYIEVFCISIFTIEYILRIIVADNKPKFIFSFFGIIDILAILPFYISTGVDLRGLRAFRLLRLFRILKLVRYNKAVHHFHKALLLAREEIILFLSISGILLFLSATGIYYFESEAQPEQFGSVFHSLWWAIVTLTTVGYGDVYPITVGGRIFTFFVLLVGLGVVAVPAGIFASALSKTNESDAD